MISKGCAKTLNESLYRWKCCVPSRLSEKAKLVAKPLSKPSQQLLNGWLSLHYFADKQHDYFKWQADELAEQTTYWVGEDTLSLLRVKKLAGNREVVVSGLQPGAVWFVYSVQVLISFFLILTGEYFFAGLFLALGIAIFCFGFSRQGHGLWFAWFATQWLLLSKDELVFKNNSRWKRSELRAVRVLNCRLPDAVEGGERLGWVIEFENVHSGVQRFQTFSRKDFQRLHGFLKAHDLPVVYLT